MNLSFVFLQAAGGGDYSFLIMMAVSYTHLTLPTIRLV